MNALLFSMPDVMPMFRPDAWRLPNLGISSIAANTSDHDVYCADLMARRENLSAAVQEAMRRVRPRLVGLSAMSFQYDTALKVAELVREVDPDVPVVLGGYHATLLYEDVTKAERSSRLLDFLIRGEGETAFNMLVHALDGEGDLAEVPGLSWKHRDKWVHNARGALEDLKTLKIPKRSARLWNGEYFFRGVQKGSGLRILLPSHIYQVIDVLETSRGCTMPCNFCSMRHMYGRTFRTYDTDRVVADIADSKKRGTQWVLFADDNITLDVKRFECLCDAIIESGHTDVSYIIQASSAGIASSERLVRKMDRANFRIVFLGIENVSERNLRQMKKGDIVEKTRAAIRYLHQYKILIVGGMIIGLPDDREVDIAENYEFFRTEQVDFFGDQIATPYPRTELRQELLRDGLVTNVDDYRRYNGFWANVRTKHLTSEELQFLRWKCRRRYSSFENITPSIREAYPVYALMHLLVIRPMRRLKRVLRNWNRTEREIFREDMRRCEALNDFFGDGGSSP
ncbi:MAG: hypothetical protein AMS16_00110 [Planctomycetes bacterium DG_58]|nr:MAG: hypothetical protein AMS16_00110 [Planctomycetes bacterium DG_58]